MKRFLLSFLILSSFSYSQETTKKASNALENYFNDNRSAIHVHLNKTTFITEEEIWFNVYEFQRDTGTINLNKQNIIVGLYNENNIEIDKSLLLLSEGSANGSFLLKPLLKSGTYYIKAFTLAMNTLDKDESFVQAIKIINPDEEATQETSKTITKTVAYDLQVLPEGGHLVSDINNTCGIKLINSYGKGVKTQNLQLIDQNEKVIINNIKTNTLGMGKFNFTPKPNSIYSIIHNEVNISNKLPKVETKGIVLYSEQNFKTGDLQIVLNTNKETLEELKNKAVTLMIHKDQLSKGYTVKFESGFPKIILNIPNKDLYKGVNTITLFNEENKPVLERLFFNHKSIKPIATYITEIEKKKDTFTYSILNKVDKQTVTSKTSISILPSSTVANSNRSNIYASVYLKPFLNGYIETPGYYFKKNNYQKQYEIDLLLLNQGWSKYGWSSIFNKQSKTSTSAINSGGITIKGYVKPFNASEIPDKIFLFSKENEKMQLAELDSKLQFELTGLDFKINSKFKFSATDKNGKPIKANFFYVVTPREAQLTNKFIIKSNNPFSTESLNDKSIFSKFDGEELDEVVINAEVLKFKKFTQDRFGIKVDSSLYLYQTIGRYFSAKEALEERMFLGSMFSPPGLDYAYRLTGGRAVFFVDGKRATISNGLLNIPMEHVIELYHGGTDAWGNKRSHIIFTDGKYDALPDHLKTSKEFTLTNTGFSIEKEFYTPLYTNYESDSYLKYGAVSWHDKVIPSEDGFAKIKLTNPGQHDLFFYIEGFSETGEPIANVVTVKSKTRP